MNDQAGIVRQFTDDMDEISGFGGDYEAACRTMVLAGLDWLDAHPDADPQFRGYENIYGVITEDNEAATGLTAAVIAASGGEATGAMHQATISHILWIKSHSWDEYVEEMRGKRIVSHGGFVRVETLAMLVLGGLAGYVVIRLAMWVGDTIAAGAQAVT